MADLPQRARVVVIGGGVGGGSIAYHLAQRGETDVVVVDRHELTSGSTFHSAGLVGQLRGSLPLTRMMMHSVQTYRDLEARAEELGTAPGWTEIGSMRIASSDARMEELLRQHGWAQTFGLPMELLSPSEALEGFPLMDLTDVRGAIFLPTDGHLDPSSLTNSFFAAARAAGVRVATHTNVTGFGVTNGRVHRVDTDKGSIECDAVVAACGMYTTDVAALVGVNVPIVPMAHQYAITMPMEGVERDLPSMRDPDNLIYYRNQGGGLIAGGYERNPAPWSLRGIPRDFNYRLLDEDWERFAPLMEAAIKRVPSLAKAEIRQLLNGPEGFTPDNEFILGESHVHGFFVAAGFCAHGIAGAGGIGRALAEWVLDGTPSFDCWKMDIRRFGPAYKSRSFTQTRTVEVYSTYYDIHYPNEERQAGRPLRKSATNAALAELGCEFGEKSMWERPNWFTPNGLSGMGAALERFRPRGWAGQHWHPAIAAEALACRQRVALFDESSFAKLRISGANALALLQRMCVNNIDRPIGSVTYTQMCNERGGIECDFTVTRLDETVFQIVTGTAFGQHDAAWIRRHAASLPEGVGVVVDDVTSAWTCLGLWGPSARDVLTPLCEQPLDSAAFPYMTAQQVMVGPIPVLAVRVTYVGELGWELYCPTEYGAELWALLWRAGQDFGVMAAGYRAIDALRIEKGYRAWASDITPDDTPFEAGLGFCVDLSKECIGAEALRAQSETGVSRKLVCLTLADPSVSVTGSEPVRDAQGSVLGRVTSGGFGFAVEKAIAYAYVPTDLSARGTPLSVEFFGEAIGAVVAPAVLWDRRGERIKA